jgi:hypothetical protein
MAGIQVDGANQKVVLDSDGDTYLEAATDDTVKVYVAGAQDFTVTANTLTAESGSTIAAQALTATTVTASGILKTDDATEATSTTDGSLQTDGGLSVVKDAVFGDDVKLLSDSSVIAFGADGDTTLTHTDGTGLTLNSTNKLCFNDASQFIQGASNAILDINATDEIELNATAVDLNGTLDVSGTSTLGGTLTVNAGAVFNEASADVDFRVESNGNANMLFVNAGNDKVGIAADPDLGKLHVKSADSGASAHVGADELVLENGGSGTAGDCGMTICAGNDSSCAIKFADDGDSQRGYIYYSHGDDSFGVGTAAGTRFVITATGLGELRGTAASKITMKGFEAKGAECILKTDEGDDNGDTMSMSMGDPNNGNHGNDLLWSFDTDSGNFDHEMKLDESGNFTTEGTHAASTTIDYAEFFEWKTELVNDAKITETYGLSVVMDNGKVRLAEAGEEAKVLGVVRPNHTSSIVGGSQEFKWKDMYEKDVWGQYVTENYTKVKWTEADGTIHRYHKDRIPSKRLKPEGELDTSDWDWHTVPSNLTSEDLVVPSTDEEKAATGYTESTTHRVTGKTLTRKKVNDTYDKSKTYTPRSERRKEWCIVGLLGQVPIRDTAIIPTSWTKMKNLESGIDLYYIK